MAAGFFSPKGATLYQPRATPWVGDQIGTSPEGATHPADGTVFTDSGDLARPFRAELICHL
jgi:hypothetical protein